MSSTTTITRPRIDAGPGPAPPRARRLRSFLARRRGVIAIVLIGFAYASVIQSFSWNQTSHYALIRAIFHGTPAIDHYRDSTGDKALDHGHWYSSRAPGLAFFGLPAYAILHGLDADSLAGSMQAQQNDDEMVWMVGLWANVLPAVVLLLLVRRLGERVEPRYGTAAAVTVGLCTLILPLGTLLFSHVFAACLGLAAFALLWRDRDGPPRLWRPALAGLAVGYAMTAEYPLLFVAIVLGGYVLLGPSRIRRAAVYAAGAVVGVLPLAIYDSWAFGSPWKVAYADLPPHQSGFFGIRPPSLSVLASLLFSSRGLLTLTPVLAMAAIGTVLLHRRGRRAEAVAIGAIALLYVLYNSGYYLPFGGAVPGPRFLTTMLPFLGVPLALAYRRFPAPTIALAGASATTMVVATLTHPLVGYQPETAIWTQLLDSGSFQPTIVSAFGAGRGWVAIIPFLALAAAGLALAVSATPRPRIPARWLWLAAAVALAWAAAAATLPQALGIDSATEHKIGESGDPMVVARMYGSYPLVELCGIAAAAALVGLCLTRVLASRRARAVSA